MDKLSKNTKEEFDDSVLALLVQQNHVESEKLIQLIQLMTMPGFKRFFEALCKIDIERVDATAMAECLERFGRIDYDLDALWRERVEGAGERVGTSSPRPRFCNHNCPMVQDD